MIDFEQIGRAIGQAFSVLSEEQREALTLRVIPLKVKSIDELNLPAETIYASTLFGTASAPNDYEPLVNEPVSFSSGDEKTFWVGLNSMSSPRYMNAV